MLRLTRKGLYPDTPTTTKTYDESMIPNICLAVAGGGWTQAQTIKAMTLQDALRRDGKAVLRNITLEIVKAESEPDLARAFDMAYEDQCRDACGL